MQTTSAAHLRNSQDASPRKANGINDFRQHVYGLPWGVAATLNASGDKSLPALRSPKRQSHVKKNTNSNETNVCRASRGRRLSLLLQHPCRNLVREKFQTRIAQLCHGICLLRLLFEFFCRTVACRSTFTSNQHPTRRRQSSAF